MTRMDANKELLFKDEAFAIVGAAMEVHSDIELKAIRSLGDNERAQALNYLKATGYSLALLLNFGSHKLDWIRLVKSH